jgi:co-chaperonin GroES (HSP10)
MSLLHWDWEREVRPMGDRILIAPDRPRGSVGGLALPEQGRRRARTGRVVATYGRRLTRKGAEVTPEVRPGDRVIFIRQFGDFEDTVRGEFLLIPEGNILALYGIQHNV